MKGIDPMPNDPEDDEIDPKAVEATIKKLKASGHEV
jgi:hypothetical protein